MSLLCRGRVAVWLWAFLWIPAPVLATEPQRQETSSTSTPAVGHGHEKEDDPREVFKEYLKKQLPATPAPSGPEAMAGLVKDLRTSPSDRQKLGAARGLAGMAARGDSAAMAALVEVLRDKDAEPSRMFAAIALRDTRSSEAVGPLIEVLEDKTLSSSLREQAALSLGHLGDARALQPLLRATDDPGSVDLRYHAYVGLTSHGFRTAAPQGQLAMKLLKDREQPQARRARAAEFVGKFGDATLVDPLVHALLAEPRSPEIASQQGKEDLTANLFAALMTKERNVRAKIATALGRVGDGRAVTPLLKVMSTAGDDPNFLQAARKALEKISKREGQTPFLSALKDPEVAVRRQAVVVLSYLDTPDAARTLKAALKDEDPGVREAAAAILSTQAHHNTGGGDASASEKK